MNYMIFIAMKSHKLLFYALNTVLPVVLRMWRTLHFVTYVTLWRTLHSYTPRIPKTIMGNIKVTTLIQTPNSPSFVSWVLEKFTDRYFFSK